MKDFNICNIFISLLFENICQFIYIKISILLLFQSNEQRSPAKPLILNNDGRESPRHWGTLGWGREGRRRERTCLWQGPTVTNLRNWALFLAEFEDHRVQDGGL
jgi:hypothetical protein